MRSTAALLALVLATACGDPPEPAGDDGGITADGGRRDPGCARDEDCQDGVFCNGYERCRPADPEADADGCTGASRLPCPAGLSCTESEGGGCLAACGPEHDADGDGAYAATCGGDDCDDADPERYPGNAEVCDPEGHDEDCDSQTPGDLDVDEDGAIDAACCDRSGARPVCGDDCDDSRPNVNRRATEACDGFDNDCDGVVDEGVLVTHWPDGDDDGYGDADATPETSCTLPTGRVDRGGDCDDANYDLRPFGGETCNTIDDDCDGNVDENAEVRCRATRPGAIAECIEGACVVTGCDVGRFDCNQRDDDGCEVDLCSEATSCDTCGYACPGGAFGGDPECRAGACVMSGPTASRYVSVVDDVTGAPIPGATITAVESCDRAVDATTDASGGADIGRSRWIRIEAPGYPPHVLPTSGELRLIPQSVLDAWRADPDLGFVPSAARATLVVDFASFESGDFVHDGILGPARYADGPDITPGGTRHVYFDTVPGRMTAGGSFSMSGCSWSCAPAYPLVLFPGTITRVSGLSCSGICA